MVLEKLKIRAELNQEQDFAEQIEVLFNPNQIEIVTPGGTVEKNGLVSREGQVSITLNLFFDTTLSLFPQNVQNYTKKIVNLTQPRIGTKSKRPPLCRLEWGIIGAKDSILLANCFLESVTKTLTQFLEDGTPVRATLNCTFKEWKEPKKQKKIENAIDDPIRIVRRGETLSSIATQEYGDPSLWRLIAQVNRLDNPRQLTPGQVLTVPPLRSASQQR